MEPQKNTGGPNNIQSKWIEKLSKKTNPKIFKSMNITRISFKILNEVQKVLVNEEENWFVLKSQKEIQINPEIDLDNMIMALSSKVPIGFYDVKDCSEPTKKKLIYKSHQRFIRNDDDANIIRTIDLHLRDHVHLFFTPLSKYSQPQDNLLSEFEVAFNNY